MRRFGRVAVIAIVQAAVVLALFEAALRLLEPASDRLRVLLYMPAIRSEFDRIETLEDLLNHSVIGFRPYREHSGFVLNSRGFRTKEYAAVKAPGTWRVAAIGDSFTFASGGMPYSDLWPAVLERDLARRVPGPVEVLSLGVPGVGPSFLRRLWQLEGARIGPDVVILAFFVGNDFTDEGGALVEDVGTGLARASYVARLARNLGRLWRADVEPAGEAGRGASTPPAGLRGGYEIPGYRESFARNRPRFSDQDILKMEAERVTICDRTEAEAFEALFRKTAGVLKSLDDEVAAAGAELVVVLIPDRFQVHPVEREGILRFLGREDSDYDWEAPQRRLVEFFEREGIDHLDLLPAFRKAADSGEVLYNPGDTHWSEAGNLLAALEIGERLAPGSRP